MKCKSTFHFIALIQDSEPLENKENKIDAADDQNVTNMIENVPLKNDATLRFGKYKD